MSYVNLRIIPKITDIFVLLFKIYCVIFSIVYESAYAL